MILPACPIVDHLLLESAMADDRVVALGLLTERDLERLGPGFQRLFPISETPDFDDLLKAIDEVDRRSRGKPQ